ncbi:MAG: hypothetical protein KAI24_26270 [Planctomycetes bacterium]|nr:hypothetical protein [Planctomycetota bacterium]
MSELRWFHPPLSGGEETGLSDAGVQTFQRPKALARETCQNIGDARDEHADGPAIATFELVNLPTRELPGVDQLREVFTACREHIINKMGSGTANEQAFFATAIRLLEGESIPTLRIGDENTHGLRGGDDDGHLPFFRLLRGQGYSKMQGAGGGTYGIGQRAPFAHSALRTVLYGSRLADGQELFIAKNILASFPDPRNGGKLTQSKGWWCEVLDQANGQWRTLRDAGRIPARFRRTQVGTDLWVTGYLVEDWERSVRHSVLEHFFAAIGADQLTVRIKCEGQDRLEINSQNLGEQLARAAAEARKAESRDDFRKGLGATVWFDRALREPMNGKPFTRQIEDLGEVQLYVYREAKNRDLPELWAKMRKPRILVEHHGSKLLSNYAAVIVCDSPEGNKFLAEMEDPKHEQWHEDVARNWTAAQKQRGARARNAITNFVRETLKQIRGAETGAMEDIPFLGRYLPADDDASAEESGAATTPTTEATAEETGRRVTKKTPTRTGKAKRRVRTPSLDTPIPGPGEQDQKRGGGGKDEGGGGGKGGDKGDGSTGDPPGDRPGTIKPNKVRFRSFARDSGYELVLHSRSDLAGDVHLRSVGEDASRYDLTIGEVTDVSTGEALSFEGSTIKNVSLQANTARRIRVRFTSKLKLCLALGS